MADAGVNIREVKLDMVVALDNGVEAWTAESEGRDTLQKSHEFAGLHRGCREYPGYMVF